MPEVPPPPLPPLPVDLPPFPEPQPAAPVDRAAARATQPATAAIAFELFLMLPDESDRPFERLTLDHHLDRVTHPPSQHRLADR